MRHREDPKVTHRRLGLAALVLLAATQLVACATTGQSSYQYQSLGDQPYFIGMAPVNMDSEYQDRYVCANGAPLMCQCPGTRLPHTCKCRCPH